LKFLSGTLSASWLTADGSGAPAALDRRRTGLGELPAAEMGRRPMENSLLVGLSRQVALSRELDVVANNVANMNTTGYKANRSMFEEYLGPMARENGFQGSDRRVSFVQDRATWFETTQGPIQQTGNPLDLAIDGNAYFVVQTTNGERYTRNGAFQINAQGQIVTTDGSQVMGENGPIQLQQTDRNISISPDGRVSVNEGANGITEALRGKLRMVNFDQPQRLRKDGNNNFLAPNGVVANPTTNVRLLQGSLEKSNINGVLEMSRLIEITRAYTQLSNMLQQENDLRRTSIEKLADVPA
jgi:flagellar basal-body rod protein FlgF